MHKYLPFFPLKFTFNQTEGMRISKGYSLRVISTATHCMYLAQLADFISLTKENECHSTNYTVGRQCAVVVETSTPSNVTKPYKISMPFGGI